MKSLIRIEFIRNLRSLLLWTGIVGGLALLMLLMYPAFKDTFSQLEDLLAIYPEEFLQIFGMGEGGLDMSDIYGWFGVEGYLFTTLIGGSYAAILGSGILSKEEDESTIEFLLSKPISRSRVIFGKSLVVLINLLLLNLVVCIVLLFSFSVFGELDVATWLLFSFAPVLLQLFFASISLLIGIFITKSRTVISISVGLVIGLYVVKIISTLTEEAEFLKYITPYEYIDAVTIVNDQTIKPLYLLLTLGVIIVSLLSSWQLYIRKDISV